MKKPSIYLKMRVLGAIDTVSGRTRHERIQNVAAMTFIDEEENPRQFTWRTIQTWFYNYCPLPRFDRIWVLFLPNCVSDVKTGRTS